MLACSRQLLHTLRYLSWALGLPDKRLRSKALAAEQVAAGNRQKRYWTVLWTSLPSFCKPKAC